MSEIRVDLYSDTKSHPTPEMRRFMAKAEVGDEQAGEDPSVNRLCRMVAELLGKEDALFLPSGTMCNGSQRTTKTLPAWPSSSPGYRA